MYSMVNVFVHDPLTNPLIVSLQLTHKSGISGLKLYEYFKDYCL